VRPVKIASDRRLNLLGKIGAFKFGGDKCDFIVFPI
jgi:hypothetical protein